MFYAVLLAAALSAAPGAASARLEPLQVSGLVRAAPAEVWNALTTGEGVSTFFSEHAWVEGRVGGAYEMYFLPDNPPGIRGGEGVRILAMEPYSRFMITWNAPPQFPTERRQHTVVQFDLVASGDGSTLVCLTHFGWGTGAGWQAVRDYFDPAWRVILGRLQYRFERGPIDWRERPDGAAYFTAAAAGRHCP